MATQETPKPNLCSNPTRKIRIVAKIRGLTAQECQSSKSWISVATPANQSNRVAISFTSEQPSSRKEICEVDHYYEQNVDIGLIFSREIKPLIQAVFDGKKATLVSFGARGTGKTYAIQGSEENPGLATLAVAEILSMAEETEKFVTVSIYDITQDRVHDVLGPNRPEVHVLENVQGKIIMKGLSQVPVQSITEFQKLLHGGCTTLNAARKVGLEQPQKSHKGLMIQVYSRDEPSNLKLVGKMNFVDLAGYEGSRKKDKNSGDCVNNVETTKINKSLYAFLNVIQALNQRENRIPYRESKLTRVLQDSLGGTNHVLILACLNPTVCQDTSYVMSLASRACHGVTHVLSDFTNMSKSSTKPTLASSMKKVNHVSLSATTKKETNSRVKISQTKRNITVRGRKLFNDRKQSSTLEQETSAIETDSNATMEEESFPSMTCEAAGTSVTSKDLQREDNNNEDKTDISNDTKFLTLHEEEESLSSTACEAIGTFKDLQREDCNNEDTTDITNDTKVLTAHEGEHIQNDSLDLVMDEGGGSPPLSARLRELSNNLKSLCTSTPLCVTKPQEVGTPYSGQLASFIDCMEPKTPIVERGDDKKAITMFDSPWESFSARSSGMKQSLVQSYLQFLNTASKEELKGIRGIGEKRATYILELREEFPEPFKTLDDLQDVGLTTKQIKEMMKAIAGDLFS